LNPVYSQATGAAAGTVATHLEKSGNSKVVREKSGK